MEVLDGLKIAWEAAPSISRIEPYATTLAAFAIVWIVIQTGLQKRAVEADESRVIRESAIFLHGLLAAGNFRRDRQVVAKRFQQNPDEMDAKTRSSFYAVLHTYAIIGLIVRNGGLRINLVNDYWGAAALKDWERLRMFVLAERQRNPRLYINSEYMMDEIQRLRNA